MLRKLVSLISFAMLGAPSCAVSTAEVADADDSVEQADSLYSTSTYYSVRTDTRRCAAPMCGGYWVSRTNRSTTRCDDGAYRSECYVVDFDFENGLSLGDTQAAELRGLARQGRALVRGSVKSADYNGRRLGFFTPTEAWTSETATSPRGTFYRVTDRGLRCKGDPCFWMHEAKLNSTSDRELSNLDFSTMGVSQDAVDAAMAAVTETGLLVAGSLQSYKGTLGTGKRIAVSQFYKKVVPAKCDWVERAPTQAELAGRSFENTTRDDAAVPPVYERHYYFSPTDNAVVVSDFVAPCPEGATCFWSGIVSQTARYTVIGNKLDLRFDRDTTNAFGLVYYKELTFQEGTSCDASMRVVEFHSDGTGTSREFPVAK